jgi:hypothetical protein
MREPPSDFSRLAHRPDPAVFVGLRKQADPPNRARASVTLPSLIFCDLLGVSVSLWPNLFVTSSCLRGCI